jgi:WD40 repeat protein
LETDPHKVPPKEKPEDYENILWVCKAVVGMGEERNPEFIVGCQDSTVLKISIDYAKVDIFDRFSGHSRAVRSLEVSKDRKYLLSGCEDHSLRIWDYDQCKSL